ncbi:MAG TPA: hypothetical protein VI980_09840 [Acidimicrobiia bacterium]|nr:hypothetical protein [Acidimicrobiia bacterium]
MGVGSSLKVIGAGVAWRTAGVESAGRNLIQAFGSDDEQDRALAGMSIVKAGERSIGLIEKARSAGRLTPSLVRLLADIGSPKARDLLAEIATESGPLAAAAHESLKLMDQIDGLGA